LQDAAKLVVYMGTRQADAPALSAKQLLAWVDAASGLPVTARDEKTLAAGLMAQPPSAGSIVAESENRALGLTMLTLSNDVKVMLKPTDFANDQVVFSASRFGGLSQFGEADIVHARYANSVVATMGLKDLSPLDLQKVLAGKATSVGITLGQYFESISGSAGRADVETMLQMMYLKLTGVRRDENLFTSFIGKQVEGARNLMAQPRAVLRDTLIETMFNNSAWVARTPPAQRA